MLTRAKAIWPNLSQSLGFLPGLIVVLFAVLAVSLVEVDRNVDTTGVGFIFQGDDSAARTVLSVIAGSLITVAGLTFSITMVVLQLASSQFSPRTLRTLFGDRVTRITIGAFVGTFVFAILALRQVGGRGEEGFVPHLAVSVASLLGIAGGLLLIVFLHHVSRMIQVSYVTARIARDTEARTEALYPEPYADEGEEERTPRVPESAPSVLAARRFGYVQRVDLGSIGRTLEGEVDAARIVVCPGDFVDTGDAIAEIWPEPPGRCRERVARAIVIDDERDIHQDADFGIRQLADTAIKALSPGINDPMTAVTCIRYVGAILRRIAERAPAPTVVSPDAPLLVARRRRFDEYLDSMRQINRYVGEDTWVAAEMVAVLQRCAEAAEAAGATSRGGDIRRLAATVAAQAAANAGNRTDAVLAARLKAAAERPG